MISSIFYNGDGSTRIFPVTFKINGEDYVRVYVDNVEVIDRTKYDIINNSIVFAPGDIPAVGTDNIKIYVATSSSELGDLGAPLTDITNVANNLAEIVAVSTQVIPNLPEILLADNNATIATNQATIATTKASEASASAISASNSATTATTKASEALASATSASNSATSASNSANTATTKANEASSSASLALTSANNASTSEANALLYENHAKGYADSIAIANIDTIEDLPNIDTSLYTTVIVKDLNRGGTFVWSPTGIANGGTVFAGVSGYWNRQYSGAVNVKWFGAKGDGVTDDTVAIQKALLLSKDIECNNLDTYVISDTLVIDRQITFNGRNSTFKSLIDNGKPLFEIHTTSNTPNDEKKFGQVYNIDFGNITINGNNKNVIGVQLDYLIGSHFHDIYIIDCHNSAIQIGYENPPTNNTVDAIRESSFSRISTNRCGSSSLNKASLQWFTCPFEIVNSSLSTDMYFTDIRLIENNWKALVIETHRRTNPSVGSNYGVITTVFEKLQIDTNTSTIQNCNVVELSHCGYGISFKDSFFVGLPAQTAGTWGYSMFKLGSSLAHANQVNSISFTNNRFSNIANGNLIQSVRCDAIRFSGNDLGTIETKRGVIFAVVNPTDLLSVFSNNLATTTFISDNNDWGLTDVFFSNKNLVVTVGEYRNTAGIFTNFQTNKVFITTTSFTDSYIIDLKPYIDALDIDLQFVRLTVYASGGGSRSYGSADMLLLDANSSAGVKSYNIVNKNSAIIDLYIDSPYGFGDFHAGEGYKFRVRNNIAATSTTAKILIEFL